MKFQTSSVTISGAICGHMRTPQSMGSTGYAKYWARIRAMDWRRHDAERQVARIAATSDVTLRDIVLSILRERGGDLQDARFSVDTVVTVTRTRRERSGACCTHSRDIPLAAWPDCADLVHPEVYGSVLPVMDGVALQVVWKRTAHETRPAGNNRTTCEQLIMFSHCLH